MRTLTPVIEIATLMVSHLMQKLTFGRAVVLQPIRDDHLPVASALYQDVEHVIILGLGKDSCKISADSL
jgi:hypothetical protein